MSRTHLAQQIKKAGARRVHANAAQHHAFLGGKAAGHDKEGSGGEIPGHRNVRRTQRLPALKRDRASRMQQLDAEGAEHPLGMIAARRRLNDARAPFGAQRREQDGRLHLGAGHRQLIVYRRERVTAVDVNRRPSVCGR